MPILATIAVITLLRGGGEEQGKPFTDPASLRQRLEAALAGQADEKLRQALPLVDELESLLRRYQQKVDASLDTYIEESAERYLSAAELAERLAPFDRERSQILQKRIAMRQQLFELLNEEQWRAVFG